MINLDKRLGRILSEIKPCNTLADIGSDHGKIAIAARQSNLARKIIASDISAESIRKCESAIKRMGIDGIQTRVGDGIEVLDESEYDTVVIAGMGAHEIINILKKRKVNFSRYILLPHRNAEKLREYLANENIAPYIDEKVYCEGKFYDLIVAQSGEYSPNEVTVLYGGGYGEDYKDFVIAECKKLENLLPIVDECKRKEYEHRLRLIKERLI